MSETCPIAYDHTDDLEECKVCGWRLENEHNHQEPRRPRDMSTLTGPERIQEAINRLNGTYAYTIPVTFICGGEE